MKIVPVEKLVGSVRLPGDKSISHRSVMLSSIARGDSVIRNFSTSADCQATVQCFRAMGVRIDKESDNTLRVSGVGKHGLRKPEGHLFCDNSGTTMRLMAGLLSFQGFESVLTGDESLSKRPMSRIAEPLMEMGARIGLIDGHAPMTVHGSSLKGVEIEPRIASAQIKSAILLAGLGAEGSTTVLEKTPTRDHTERMLRWLGVEVAEGFLDGGVKSITVNGEAGLTARDIDVPSDISSAMFFLVAAGCMPGSRLVLADVGMNSSRTAGLDVLRQSGVKIEVSEIRMQSNEPVADIIVEGGIRQPDSRILISGSMVPNLIDELPALSVLGTRLEHGLEVRDASELRVKESDRIAAVVTNLRNMGADVDEFDDGFLVRRSELRGTTLDCFGDHRIAMSFAVAGMLAEGETELIGSDCVSVSFPDFFDKIGALAG